MEPTEVKRRRLIKEINDRILEVAIIPESEPEFTECCVLDLAVTIQLCAQRIGELSGEKSHTGGFAADIWTIANTITTQENPLQ
jgi:hypothetical protein